MVTIVSHLMAFGLILLFCMIVTFPFWVTLLALFGQHNQNKRNADRDKAAKGER